jgi:hypothetical protein
MFERELEQRRGNYETMKKRTILAILLSCTIDPTEIRQKAGGGAQCAFETGQ